MKNLISAISVFFLLIATFAVGDFSNVDKQFFAFKNLLKNPGFEQGKSNWRLNLGGTYSISTTAANVGSGSAAAQFTSDRANYRFGSSLVTVPAGLYNRNCLLSFSYKGGDDKYVAAVDTGSFSGSSLASVTLSSQSTYKREYLSFICPSSGQISAAIYTTGSGSTIYLDDFYLGENNQVGQISQANFVGSAYFDTTSNCTWQRQNATLGAFTTDSDCPGPTIDSQKIGSWQTTDADLPRLTIKNLPPGNYQLIVTGPSQQSSSASNSTYVVTDGTTSSGYASGYSSTGSSIGLTIVANFEYTAAGDRTFEVYGRSDGTAVTEISLNGDNRRLTFNLYRFPSTQESAVRLDQSGWFVDANVYGAEPSLGTSSVSSYTPISDGSLQLVLNSGSLTAQIPCTGGNASTGLTCTSGSEYIGVSYSQPVAGPVEACASFGHYYNLNANSFVAAGFQVIETANTSDTIVTEGNTRINTGSITGGSSLVMYSPVKVCGTFNFTSSGQKTLKLAYEQNKSGTLNSSVILANRTSTTGQEDVHWTVRPIAQASTMPVITNSVSTSSSGQVKVEAAQLNCDGSAAITSQNGSWISSIGNISSGQCSVAFSSGAFSSAPYCTASEGGTFASNILSAVSTSTSGTSLSCKTDAGGNCTSFDANLVCIGAK